MDIYSIINTKAKGLKNTKEEINFLISGFVNGNVADYQMSAYLMAVRINSMSKEETFYLTDAMIKSGSTVDLSAIDGICVDKHSTGGVGDSTTFIVAPILASLGYKFAKMSGRGLGHTGGTLDKLECINGFNINLPQNKFIKTVNEVGCAVISQTSNLVPADKMMYALRDVTATVESMPLIASSIMSKKLVSGASKIVLDVKYGFGAFMKTPGSAIDLAKLMVDIGENAGKKICCVISCMDNPLGEYVGNSLELLDAIQVLLGKKCELSQVAIRLARELISLCKPDFDKEKIDDEILQSISSGRAYQKLIEMVKAQGGDISFITDSNKLTQAKFNKAIIASNDGYINYDTVKLGLANCMLGGGRIKKTDIIDHFVGIKLEKKANQKVNIGDKLATVYFNANQQFEAAKMVIDDAILVGEEKPARKLLYAIVSRNCIEYL